MYRHSLFYQCFEDAENAVPLLHRILNADAEIDGVISDDECNECRFYTPDKLNDFEQRVVVHQTTPDSYALNCEDY